MPPATKTASYSAAIPAAAARSTFNPVSKRTPMFLNARTCLSSTSFGRRYGGMLYRSMPPGSGILSYTDTACPDCRR